MSLKPSPIQPIPEETVRVARAAFPKGNLYLDLRDKLGPIYEDALFTALYPHDGQPTVSPWRLAGATRVTDSRSKALGASSAGRSARLDHHNQNWRFGMKVL